MTMYKYIRIFWESKRTEKYCWRYLTHCKFDSWYCFCNSFPSRVWGIMENNVKYVFFCNRYYVNIIYKPDWVIKVILLLWGWLVNSVLVSFLGSAATEANGCSSSAPKVSQPVQSSVLTPSIAMTGWQVDHPVAMEDSQIGKKWNKGIEKSML